VRASRCPKLTLTHISEESGGESESTEEGPDEKSVAYRALRKRDVLTPRNLDHTLLERGAARQLHTAYLCQPLLFRYMVVALANNKYMS